jgi:hypothetical protein
MYSESYIKDKAIYEAKKKAVAIAFSRYKAQIEKNKNLEDEALLSAFQTAIAEYDALVVSETYKLRLKNRQEREENKKRKRLAKSTPDEKKKALLFQSKNIRAYPTPRQRTLIIRDGDKCHLCGELMTFDGTNNKLSATFDHIIPRSKGGNSSLANLKLAHKHCNSVRGDKLIQEAENKNECGNLFFTPLTEQ